MLMLKMEDGVMKRWQSIAVHSYATIQKLVELSQTKSLYVSLRSFSGNGSR